MPACTRLNGPTLTRMPSAEFMSPRSRALPSPSPRTWECVSTSLRQLPELEFQKRIMRSAVPPPDASKFFCHGHHAKALTAA